MKESKTTQMGSVLVVGGGVAGVQSALDLSDLGYYVYLVEKSASIGGVMARLDKTFPTNDCSICILAPKLVEAGRSPNIKLITKATLTSVDGTAGNFTAKVHREPRYINEDLCTACGTCTMYCPIVIPDIYNEGFTITRNPHMDYPQAVPASFYIDPKECLFANHETCRICVSTCPAQAIDLDAKEETIELSVGAVILSPGFGSLSEDILSRFGYGVYPNVLTSMEFERMMCASGPSNGVLFRPSDEKHPKRIAILQCVGSRDITCGNGYCSSVCCMYAIKEATVVKEHDPDLEITIFYMEMRTQGKGFDAARQRAKEEYGLRFVRARVAGVNVNGEQLRIPYVNEKGEHLAEDFDIVVLAQGLESPADAESLAQAAEIDLNHYNFCKTNSFGPLETTRPGIFVAGAFQGPKDIPDSVTQASGAAAHAAEILRDARGTQTVKKEYPTEIEIEKEPRIGVFICHCGINIGGVVDVPAVKEYASTLGNVVFFDRNPYSCSQDTQITIKEKIEEHKLNRIVVAACTPRTHEPLFQETLRAAGLNRGLFEMVNIRDQCSWVHMHEPEKATDKAKELVKMAVEKAKLLTPLAEQSVPVIPRALVIGGGVSGMTVALSIAEQGFECFLVEKNDELGGNLNNLVFTLTGEEPHTLLEELKNKVEKEPLINVYTGANVDNVSGYVGNFTSSISYGSETESVEHGVVIVATGGRPYQPTQYLYEKSNQVVTQLELEKILSSPDDVQKIQDIVMIQCVGSRGEDLAYCSKICCGQAVKNALKILELNPNTNIYILYRDMRTYGFAEDYYREAREKGVIFIHYEKDMPPSVTEENGKIKVEFLDPLLDERVVIEPDILALSVGVVPHDVDKLAKDLKVPLTSDKFFLEAHAKLRPVEFSVSGIYLCGLAHSPKPIDESIAQAKAAASKAGACLAKGFVSVDPIVSVVNQDACIGCGICESLCPYKAIRTIKVGKKKKAETISASCKGCG
ncbi:MAG: FAD-dependent oxidoreductase, partial [Proteobacteria bacterium]|nr:FAD-dependent oxidoreductase [Pseudomonadota bacterium]